MLEILKNHIKLSLDGLLTLLINWATILYPRQPLPSNIWNQRCPVFVIFFTVFFFMFPLHSKFLLIRVEGYSVRQRSNGMLDHLLK